MNKFYFFSLLFLSFLLSSCTADSFLDYGNDTPNVNTNYNFGSNVNRNIYGTVLDTNGNPVSGAMVSVGSASVQTNSKGLFVIKNAAVQENFAYIKVKKAGFVNGSRTIVPNAGDNSVRIMLIPATTTSTVASGSVSTVSLSNGTKVKFDGSFKDDNGNAYSGNVNVAVFHLKPSDTYLNELMPGSLLATNLAGESRIMDTYGMLHVELTGAAGQKLNIADGHTAEITVAIDPSQTSFAPATIPLWSFNGATGIWQEDGSAAKVGNNYVGTVKHFSWWNCDAQFPQAILHAKVVNSANVPVANVNVELQRNGQTYFTSAFTNVNGEASGVVPANETLSLRIKNSCGTVIYSSTIGPFTQGIVNVLPTITLPSNTVPTTTISGTLKDCSGNNVTNGLVALMLPNSSSGSFFAAQNVLVTNGAFSFTILNCGNSSFPFTLNGVDYIAMQESGAVNFTATSANVNVGNIVTCTSVTEFITYQIDGQAPKTITTPNVFTVFPNMIASYGTNTPANAVVFSIEGSTVNVASTVTINSGYTIRFSDNSNIMKEIVITGTGGNAITININGTSVVGNYVDFTFNGTYTDGGAVHTISGTGHVKRDQ